MVATRTSTPVCSALAREGRLQGAYGGNQGEIQPRLEDFGRRDSGDEVPEGAEPPAADVPDVRVPERIFRRMPEDGVRLVIAHGTPGVVGIEDEVEGGGKAAGAR